MNRGRRKDEQKEKYWQGIISKASRSGMSIRSFCQAEGIHEAQFYSWRRKLKMTGNRRKRRKNNPEGHTSFALVTDERDAGTMTSAGIELILAGNRRLRIGKGVDPETLAGVVTVLERDLC